MRSAARRRSRLLPVAAVGRRPGTMPPSDGHCARHRDPSHLLPRHLTIDSRRHRRLRMDRRGALMTGENTRVLTWSDPLATRERLAALSGIEAMRAWRDGLIPPPPISETIGFR